MRTPEEKKKLELAMFGCYRKELRESIEESISFSISPGMIAMSILSDSQEELERGLDDMARQSINRAKWVISEYLMKEDRRAA